MGRKKKWNKIGIVIFQNIWFLGIVVINLKRKYPSSIYLISKFWSVEKKKDFTDVIHNSKEAEERVYLPTMGTLVKKFTQPLYYTLST